MSAKMVNKILFSDPGIKNMYYEWERIGLLVRKLGMVKKDHNAAHFIFNPLVFVLITALRNSSFSPRFSGT